MKHKIKNQSISKTSIKKDESGEVYILTNPSFIKNLLKIGRAKDVEERAKTLFTTGVPTPFKIFVSMKVNNYKATEKYIHDWLDENYPTSRTYKNREFFKIDRDIALNIFKKIAPLVNGEIKIYSEQDNESVIEEIEDNIYSSRKLSKSLLNTKLFDKVISFDKDSLEIRDEILSGQINDILFFANIVNMFGPIKNRKKMTHNMVNNIKKIKELIKRCPNVKIHFWGNESICKHFKKICKIIGINTDKNVRFKNINNVEELINNIKDMKFDAAILNPPYLKMGYINILEQVVLHTDKILFISPLTWLLNEKRKNKVYQLASEYKCTVKYINSNDYFGGNGYGLIGVTYIDKTIKEKSLTLNECVIDNITENVLLYSDGISILRNIRNIIEKKITDNFQNHIYSTKKAREKLLTQSKNVKCVIIPRNIGDNRSYLFSNQYMCLIRPSDVKNNTVIKNFKDFIIDKDLFYIPCKNSKYAENIVKFSMTLFARVCLSIYKHGIDLIKTSPMRCIPWEDEIFEDNDFFSGTISEINDRLFKRYGLKLTKSQNSQLEKMFPKVYQLKNDTYEYKN